MESAHLKVLLFEHYDEICEDVLKIAHHPVLTKNRHIESALLDLLPKLAAFQREIFVTKYLSSTMNYMDRLLQPKERSDFIPPSILICLCVLMYLRTQNGLFYRYNAYIGIGFLAVATGPDIQNYLRNVLTSIRMCLPAGAASSSASTTSSKNTKKRDTNLDPAVFACVSMLARAVKHSINFEVS